MQSEQNTANEIFVLLKYYAVHIGSKLQKFPPFKSQAVQEVDCLNLEDGTDSDPKHWYLTTNLHCKVSQESKDLIYTAAAD
jgi:hypothetical protein